MSTFLAIFFSFLGLFVFSFLFWRRLREDYPAEQIFSLSLAAFLGAVLGSRFSFWLAFLLGFLFVFYFLKRFSFRLFEVIDAYALSWFYLAIFLFLAVFVLEGDRLILGEILAAVPAIFLYAYLAGRFRRFSWYPSGKVGFLGLSSFAFYFLVRLGLAIVQILVLSSSNWIEVLANGIVASFLLFVLYARSGRAKAEKLALRFENLLERLRE